LKVKSRFRSIEALPPDRAKLLSRQEGSHLFPWNTKFAPLGTEFIVYGIEFVEGNLCYRIGNPPQEAYTILGLAVLFDVTDPRVSRHWEFHVGSDGWFTLGPSSWSIEFYHDRLSDGEPELVDDFASIKKRFAEEYFSANRDD
jgi:hypothetical protein